MKIPHSIATAKPEQQSELLKVAVDSGQISTESAAKIARQLRFPDWERFANTRVGTTGYGGASPSASTDARQLGPNTPLFVAASFGSGTVGSGHTGGVAGAGQAVWNTGAAITGGVA